MNNHNYTSEMICANLWLRDRYLETEPFIDSLVKRDIPTLEVWNTVYHWLEENYPEYMHHTTGITLLILERKR